MRARLVTPENKKWWTLAAVSVGLFMIMLDNTVVNVALPSMRRSLHMSLSELEWVVAGYALTFAAFMLTGGKLADYVGRRLIFMVGLTVFTGASLACGLAPNGGFLIGARVVQGLGGALMNPATLSIITATFPPRERGKAIGIWAGVSGMALAIGPLVGGLLTEHVNWNWIFFINVPVGIAGLLAIPLFIDESRDTSHEQRLDLPGLSTSAIGLFSLTYAFIEANSYGWASSRILGAFGVAAVMLVAFVLFERHQRAPMLELALFKNRTFSGANGAMLFVGLAMFGTFFYVSLYMQNVLHYSPVKAGASFLPMTLLIILIAPRAGALTDKVGSRWLVGLGMALLAVMLFYYSQLGANESFWAILPGLLIGGVGMGATMTPVTAAAMSAVAVDKAGVGSAVLNSSRQVGGSLGIAVMGAIVAAGSDFLTGFHDALRVGALLCLVGAAVAVLAVRKIEHPQHGHEAAAVEAV
ncbi:MAG TPA: MFS transporter [Gaiellaceae bacterium]|jgi:EmrB/QacA subfamily drug resistance transporter|nr:MFS transporter [Gaiellaceae bacterium]